MKAYQAYKDSGISWIGQIPQHWEKCRCKDLFTELKEQVGEDSNKYTLLSLTINGVIVRDLSEGKGKFPKDFESYKIVKPDNLVFCLFDVDETPRTVGHVKQIGMLTGAYNVFEVRNANIEYLYHYFISLDDRKSLKPLYKGLRKVIPLPAFMAMSIFLPPLAEQEAIVSYLEEKTAKIDRFVTKKEEQILRLKELREAIIAQAVTRGIQPDVALRPSGVSWLSDIPEHWEVKRLGLSFKENKNLNSSLECTEAYKFNYGTLVRKDEGVNFEELAETYVKYTLLQENDIVINGLNLNYDFVTQRVALATQMGIITSSYLVLSPREGVNHHYYSLLFKAMDSMKLFHGMGSGIRLTLSYKDLKNQALPLPPLSEQEAIIAYITEKTEQINQLIKSYRQEIDRIKELKQGLISDAVLGRINVQTE